ncbi:restriction endonuclease subunit S [Bacteroides caccae]|uniref:restriction endonuclease subunit S n=1 Tax=Bacteroides caccae TaxID=47678 RepID=UPI0026E13FB9|nr:restriction endonuclease subunit S [Bacteroides caccae]MDO6327235.1 restriction endonuclease subunit S [Bacteroides caccae]
MANNNENKVLNVPHLRFPEFTEEWVTKSINDLAVVIGGGTPDTTVKSYWDGEIQWFTPSEIGKNKYVDSSLRTITEVGLNNSSAKLLPPNTILLSSRATIGECSLSLRECATNQGFQCLVSKKCNVDFLYYLIQTKKKDLIRKSCGSTFLEISANEVRKIQVSVPSDVEQQKIAELLSLIDERIATQNKIIEKYESLIQAICDTLIEAEQHKVELSFNDFGEPYSGLSSKSAEDFGEGYQYITYMNVYQNQIIDTTDVGLVKINETEQQSVVCYGDILFTLSSETPNEVGMGAVYLGDTYPLYLNSFCFGVHIIDESKIFPPFLAYYISTKSFRKAIFPLAQGSTRFNLQKNDFMKKMFLFPMVEKQNKIYTTLKAYSDKLSIEKHIAKLFCEQKSFLLRQMFI